MVALMPVGDQWVYSIEYSEPPKNGCADCSSTPFQIIVTMDGVAVPARVLPWKPQAKHP